MNRVISIWYGLRLNLDICKFSKQFHCRFVVCRGGFFSGIKIPKVDVFPLFTNPRAPPAGFYLVNPPPPPHR